MNEQDTLLSYKFPTNFIWGTATSAHQTEGNNTNSDWWRWEQKKDYEKNDRKWPLEPSGIADDSYNRYEKDFDLAKELNNNAIRISIEWARIEPKEGEFDKKEIEHYRKVLKAARSKNLKTFVTLHHFTNPIWFADLGAFANSQSKKYFSRYAKKVAEELGDLIDVFYTINEPQVYAMMSYLRGIWYPAKRNPFLFMYVQRNMMRAHKKAYVEIKTVNPEYQVGVVKNIVWYEAEKHIWDKAYAKFLNFVGADFFLLPVKKHLDTIGLNFYFTTYLNNFKTDNPDDFNSDLGWYIDAKGLENVLLTLRKFNLPIYITENGCADSSDRIRIKFIKDMLEASGRVLDQGVDLRGYFHWSLIDNYEWHEGYWPRFGLVEIDRNNNLKRIPRKSYYFYKEVCSV